MSIDDATADHSVDKVVDAPKELTLQERFAKVSQFFLNEFFIVRRSARLQDGCVFMTLDPSYVKPDTREKIKQKLAEVGITVFHFTNDGPRVTAVDQAVASTGTATMSVLDTATGISTLDPK